MILPTEDGEPFVAAGAGNDLIIGGESKNEIDGEAGDNALSVVGNGTMTGGEGEDVFGVRYSPEFAESQGGDFSPAEITDFIEGQDLLYLETTGAARRGTITVEPWEDGTGTNVFVNDMLAARVAGGVLTVDDTRVPTIDIRTDLLGFH